MGSDHPRQPRDGADGWHGPWPPCKTRRLRESIFTFLAVRLPAEQQEKAHLLTDNPTRRGKGATLGVGRGSGGAAAVDGEETRAVSTGEGPREPPQAPESAAMLKGRGVRGTARSSPVTPGNLGR